MEQKIISNKATWSFQEILPILIAIGLGVTGIFLGITETFILSGAIITSIVGFGLALYVFGISSRRKWKSTLFAELSYDKNFNVSVWMRKPIVEKWTGKLDKGKNSGRLSRISSIQLETIRGTRVLNISTLDKKPLYVPTRFLNNKEMKNYIAAAVASLNGKVKFENKQQATEFAQLIAGAETLTADKTFGTIDGTLKDKSKTLPKNDKEDEVLPAVVEETVPVKPVKKVGYGSHKKIGTKEKIAKAVNEANQAQDAEEEKNEIQKIDNLLGFDNTKSEKLEDK